MGSRPVHRAWLSGRLCATEARALCSDVRTVTLETLRKAGCRLPSGLGRREALHLVRALLGVCHEAQMHRDLFLRSAEWAHGALAAERGGFDEDERHGLPQERKAAAPGAPSLRPVLGAWVVPLLPDVRMLA